MRICPGRSIADLYQMGWTAGTLAGHAIRDKPVPGISLPKDKLSSHGILSFILIIT